MGRKRNLPPDVEYEPSSKKQRCDSRFAKKLSHHQDFAVGNFCVFVDKDQVKERLVINVNDVLNALSCINVKDIWPKKEYVHM